MKPSLKLVEKNFLAAVCARIDDPVVNERVSYLFTWYSRKAQHNKHWYNWTRFITYLIPCLITLISVYASIIEGNGKWAIAVTATLSAALVGIHHVVDHFRFYENWIRYRGTAEKLKREAELFLNRVDPYNKSVTENRKRFAAKIERVTKTEIDGWENLQEESHKPFRDENQAALQNGQIANGGSQPAADASQNAASVSAFSVCQEAPAAVPPALSETACDPETALAENPDPAPSETPAEPETPAILPEPVLPE